MPQVVISPFPQDDPDVFQAVNLEIVVRNTDFLGQYDQLEIWRSRATSEGPFCEVTGTQWSPARLPKGASDQPPSPVAGPSQNLVGQVLSFLLKESFNIAVTFTGTDPLTVGAVSSQIVAQGGGFLASYVTSAGQLVVQTTETGTGAVLRVLPSDAASILALPTQDPAALSFGRTTRLALIVDQEVYNFVDVAGSPADYYRTRFRNRTTSAVSDFSFPFNAGQSAGLSVTNLAVGYLDLVALDGKPLAFISVSLRCVFNGNFVEGRLVAGNDLIKSTDCAGHVEFLLIRGQAYTMCIAGTNLVKDFTVPVDPTVATFSLIDPSLSVDSDYFAVRVPNLPTLERRSI